MGIFDKIKSAIFGQAKPASPAPGEAPKTVAPTSPVSASMSGSPASTSAAAPAGSPAPVTTAAAPAASAPSAAGAVDIGPILDAAVKKSGQKLNWKNSIVDLMKALNLDSSLAARKELADELGYTGDKGDSATMNVWLHKAWMTKLAENGGVVPAELTD